MSTLLEQAIERIKAGDIATARNLLRQELTQNPKSEYAWMASSHCASDDNQKRYCLNKVLEINPNNEIARRELGKLSSPPTSPLQALTSTPKPNSSIPTPVQQTAPVPPPPAVSVPPVKESTSTIQPSVTVLPAQTPARVAAQPAKQKQQSTNKNPANKSARTQKK
jgi:hypothetical protein